MSKEIKDRVDGRAVRENQLDFLYKMYLDGIAIGNDNVEMLKKHRYIKPPKTEVTPAGPAIEKINEFGLKYSNEANTRADANIDIIELDPSVFTSHYDILTDTEFDIRRKSYGHVFEGRKKEISSDEWKPESNTVHSPEFIDWINSINRFGFRNKVKYRKFTLYAQQAYTWLQENKTPRDFEHDDDRLEYIIEELRRCDENSLYFLNKYVYYKEGDDLSGRVKYIAAPAHEFLAYLNDCGYSVGLAKGRQMAATTTLMALDVHDMVFKPNFFIKFLTEDEDKAVEIFNDKLKFCFETLPQWMQPDVLNYRDNFFKLAKKGEEKGQTEGVGSKMEVVAAKRTAIAGGAPQKVKIDEAGNIKILGIIIGNIRPTMLFHDKRTNTLVMKRMLWFWGTGGETEKGGKAFETELMTIMKMWDELDFSAGIIPVFMDWTCRPGATQEDYDREKRVAYAKGSNDQDPDSKRHITEFHQSWPTSLSDVFRTSAKMLIDEEFVEGSLTKILEIKKSKNYSFPQYGYFEPIYDETRPTDEGSDVPFKIIGANFIPTSDMDRRASTMIFMHPEKWENRYFQGTDPINTYTGLSKMSSTVWDKYFKCPVALLDWRIPDYNQVFLQTLLLGIYYDPKPIKTGIKELLESNVGLSYTQYKTTKGFDREFVLNYQIQPLMLQNRTSINEGVGIDNKGARNTMIINFMFQMFKQYGDNFLLSRYFEQLKTFTCAISANGKEMWGPVNKKYFNDDALFGGVFSYICAELCFPELQPRNLTSESSLYKVGYKLVRDKDNKLSHVPVKVRVK